MILCYIEMFFLHYTGPTGGAAARPLPRVPSSSRVPRVVPVLGRARGGTANAGGGRRGHERVHGGGQVRGAAVPVLQ